MQSENIPSPTKPDDQASAEIYADGTYLQNNATWHVEDSPWKARQIEKLLSKNSITPETVCEVGCGAGEILKQLSMKMPNTRFFGYELSPQAFRLCQARQSSMVQYLNTSVFTDDLTFDTLLCIDVFEHVEDYIGFVRQLRTKATYKVFHIPLEVNVLSVLRGTMLTQRKRVGHLHYFTPATGLATLEDAGYEVIDWFLTPAFDDLPGTSFKSRLGRVPRKLLYSISPGGLVKILGGCSMIVLAK